MLPWSKMSVRRGSATQRSATQRPVALFIPTLGEGGAERVAVNLLKLLDGQRELWLLEPRFAYEHQAQAVRVIGRNFVAGKSGRMFALAESWRGLRAVKSQTGADCVSFTTWPNILNVLTRGPGRVVLTVHNHESSAIRGRSAAAVRALVRTLYPRADAIVAVSQSVADDLVASFGIPAARIDVIHNAIDLVEIERLRGEVLAEPYRSWMRVATVTTAGRLVEQKGQWRLLRAFAELRKKLPAVRLLILGAPGPFAERLVELARGLGLRTWAQWEAGGAPLKDQDVAFPGFQGNPFAFFASSTLFVLPSLWEGFGNVLLEAMACSVPVIASDCHAGPREILGLQGAGPSPVWASAGILLPPPEPEWAGADAAPTETEQIWTGEMCRLLGDAEQRRSMAVGARARAAAFALDATREAWLRVVGSGGRGLEER